MYVMSYIALFAMFVDHFHRWPTWAVVVKCADLRMVQSALRSQRRENLRHTPASFYRAVGWYMNIANVHFAHFGENPCHFKVAARRCQRLTEVTLAPQT